MAIEYLGLSSINGPLIVLEGVQDAFFDEIVEFVVNGNERKLGRSIEIYEDKAVIQVFEGLKICLCSTPTQNSPDIRWRSPSHRICSEEHLTESGSRLTISVRLPQR